MGNLFTQPETPESLSSFQQATVLAWKALEPPPTFTVSEWADRHRFLPKGSTSKPGQWVTRAFQREMMDAVLEMGIRKVIFMTSTQLVKSEALNNIIGYFIDAEPKSIMLLRETDIAARNHSKKRIAPMIDFCPALKSKVRVATSRAPGNTVMLKEFDGGFLKIAGANNPTAVCSDPIEVLVCDEVDSYPDDPDGQGDPLDLAARRTDNFPFPVIVWSSSPKKPTGFSIIEKAYEESDQRRYYVPCPFCTCLQPLEWRDAKGVHRLVWEKTPRGDVVPDSVRYLCAHCGEGIPEHYKLAMLEAGRWVKHAPEVTRIAGFHLNALYSPWKPIWEDLAREWMKTKDNPEKLRSFLNTRLAETYNEGALKRLTPAELKARMVENFGAFHILGEGSEAHYERVPDADLVLPAGVCVLVSSVDVQDKWIEAQTAGFGVEEQYWLLDHERFDGEPGSDMRLWEQLEDFLLRSWRHPSGVELSAALTLIDSGAHTDSVYDFVMPRQNAMRRVYACKGDKTITPLGTVKEGTTKRGNVRLFIVGTDAMKDRIFARMNIPAPGPGYFNFPPWVKEDYFEQLTAEKKKIKTNRWTGVSRREYSKKSGDRNEALDLTVYCFGALAVLQQIIAPRIYRDLAAVAAVLAKAQRPETLQPARFRRMRTAPILQPMTF